MLGIEWWMSSNAREMLRGLGEDTSPRKLRLFACACCRYVCEFIPDREDSLRALDVAEDYADSRTSFADMAKVESATFSFAESVENLPILSKIAMAVRAATWTASPWYVAWEAVGYCRAAMYEQAYRSREPHYLDNAEHLFADLLRDVFGDLYLGIAVPAGWADSFASVRELAREIYWQRAFDRLPVLGDELKRFGCANDAVLSHCSTVVHHAKGCWVLDLVLGQPGLSVIS